MFKHGTSRRDGPTIKCERIKFLSATICKREYNNIQSYQRWYGKGFFIIHFVYYLTNYNKCDINCLYRSVNRINQFECHEYAPLKIYFSNCTLCTLNQQINMYVILKAAFQELCL